MATDQKAGTGAHGTPVPAQPCGCLHLHGQTIVTCPGPHTTGSGETLRWSGDGN